PSGARGRARPGTRASRARASSGVDRRVGTVETASAPWYDGTHPLSRGLDGRGEQHYGLGFGGGQVRTHPKVFQGSARYPHPSPGPILTMGNFDGVHRGHRHLLDLLVERAREAGRPACVFTFDPAPRDVLRPGNPIPRIQTLADRLRRLGEVGVDHVVV